MHRLSIWEGEAAPRRTATRAAGNKLALALATVALAVVPAARGGSGGAHALPPDQVPAFAAPRMSRPPTIDGAIDPVEWREAVAVSGVGNLTDDVLIPRPTTFYFAWDPGHLYFACRTYLRPNYRPSVKSGRSQGLAYIWDDGLELHWQPMGANVPGANRNNSYKWFLNCLGFIGDCSRLALGQQFKNWNPQFTIRTRLTEPGTAPDGGRWWEMEMSSVPADFELAGENRAGDQWRVMLGIDHIPVWMQARIACNGSYLDPFGYNVLTLVEHTPAVQMTMDRLDNLATDGTAALTIRAYNPATTPASVTVTANVADVIQKVATLNLPPGKSGEFTLDEKLPATVQAGRVWLEARQGERQLFRHTFNFQVGAHAFMSAPLAPQNATNFAFETRFNPVRGWLLVKADTYYLDDPARAQALRYRVTPEHGGGAIATGRITQVAEYYLQDVIRLPSLAPGTYVIEATMELSDGRALGPMAGRFEKQDEAKAFPGWWGKKAGNIERVLAPYEAIEEVEGGSLKMEGEEALNHFSLLGREYAFDALGLPTAIRAAGEAVLAAPAQIVVTVDGREIVVPVGRPTIVEHKDWRVRFAGQARGAGLDFKAEGWLEQDGLVYVDLTFGPGAGPPVKIDALRIEYPLAEADADCLLCIGPGANYSSRTTMLLPRGQTGRLWSTLDTGITGCGMALGSFYPTVWIGSERRGFLWWADNDQGWVQDNRVPAHDVVRAPVAGGRWEEDGGAPPPATRHPQPVAVVLRNHIVAKPTALAGPRTISFSYIATPFKPMPAGFRTTITTEDGTFWVPFRGMRKDSKTGAPVQEVRGHCNWIHPESRYPDEWPALWAEQKAQADAHAWQYQWQDPYKARSGINFTHMSFQIVGYGRKSCEDSVYAYFGPEWESAGNDVWNESYIDYAMHLFEPAFRDGGVRHTYWDLAFPILFHDPLTGLAYRLPDGRIQPGYAGWNVRRFMMRLWALLLDAGLVPGGNGFHSTNAYLPIAMPWADAVTDAERPFHLDSNPLDWVDNYPPERMRAMSVCHSWGVGIAWMSMFEGGDPQRRIDAARKQAQWVWMHDSWLNNWLSADHQPVLATMPDAVLDWGVNAATYYPYWRNPYVAGTDSNLLVSLWHTPGDGHVALGVFNYGPAPVKKAAVTVDLAGLGLTAGPAYARTLFADGGARAEFDAARRRLRVTDLPAHKAIMVGLAAPDPAEIARAAAALPAWASGPPAKRAARLPPAVLDFGFAHQDVRHVPPDQPAGVQCRNAAIQVGMWQLPDRVLLSVYNTSTNAAEEALLQVDLPGWRLMPRLPWQEFVRVRQLLAEDAAPVPEFDFNTRTLALRAIPPGRGRLVAIRLYANRRGWWSDDPLEVKPHAEP